MSEFAGKHVLVTGGTSGIGLALADSFREAGAKVAVCARSTETLQEFAATRRDALAIRGDVTVDADRETMLDRVMSEFGGLDILVNNAGRLIERDFIAAPPATEGIAAEFALNLLAPIALTSAFLRLCAKPDAIVFVSSGYALASPRRAPTYGAAKAGLHGFADGLRRQFEGSSTQVLEVVPPVVDTPATAHRAVRKVSPGDVADATLAALRRRKHRAYVGAAQFLPVLLRLAPSFSARLVGSS